MLSLMPDGYHPDYSEHSDEQLDELLCEYVDGTMDHAVRAAFEEYLEANPELAKHARCLCQTRSMLCSYGCRHPNEESVQDQVRKRVAGELIRQDRSEAVLVQRLGRAAVLTSSISLVLILAMTVGYTAVQQAKSTLQQTNTVDSLGDTMVLPTDAYGQPLTASFPLEWSRKQASWSILGPSHVLPEIDLVPIGWHAARVDTLVNNRFAAISAP